VLQGVAGCCSVVEVIEMRANTLSSFPHSFLSSATHPSKISGREEERQRGMEGGKIKPKLQGGGSKGETEGMASTKERAGQSEYGRESVTERGGGWRGGGGGAGEEGGGSPPPSHTRTLRQALSK